MNRKDMLARLKKGENPLELSIKKWQDMANGKGMNTPGQSNCALCEVYKDCDGCPISEKTSQPFCQTTPFEDYLVVFQKNKPIKIVKKMAKKELEFLKSLRPKETKP